MWYIAETRTSRPEPLDTTSSKVYNYVRKDIEELPVVDPDTGAATGEVYWRYMERKIPKEYYEIYEATEQTKADIDYIAMMSDIDL